MTRRIHPQNVTTLKSLRPAIIAIDGPAASGKSTVGFQLAEQINYLFFDTGVMYRAVTWAVQQRGMDPHDQTAVGKLAAEVQIDVAPPHAGESDGRQCTVLVDGVDVTWAIRGAGVDQHVSVVAANAMVRSALTEQQRRIGLHYGTAQEDEACGGKEGIIMVGRDMGTVVVPEAPLKIYMDASPAERARRRWLEQRQRGRDADYDEVLAGIHARDKIDSERALAPLRPAEDAIVIDTSTLSIEEVIEAIIRQSQWRETAPDSPGKSDANSVNTLAVC